MFGCCCKASDAAGQGQDAQSTVAGKSEQMAEEVVMPAGALPKKKEREETFIITLTKTADMSKLGVDVDLQQQTYMEVDRVNDGLVKDWNLKNPSKEVKVGDHIIEVNKACTADAMSLRCKEDQVLEMKIRRGSGGE
mmetsp:Transcript_59235/g.190580  ORF Transcript_59235/g.190580 Transcript_59235/m.190580 type:complete len:137 (+) Transcript_59235:108-518(+)